MFEDERARMIDGVVQARNYADAQTELAYSRAVASGDQQASQELLRLINKTGQFFNHMPAALAKRRLPSEFWDKAFKFSIERHPYEKAVSWAYFILGLNNSSVMGLPRELVRSLGRVDDSAIYTIDGALVVDRMLRYEAIESDFAEVVDRLGLPRVALPRAKGQYRKDRRSAREILTPAQRAHVVTVAKQTFERFGYLP